MIPLALALSFLGTLTFVGYLFHLRAERPLPLHEGVDRAIRHATQAMDTAQLTQQGVESDFEKIRKELAEQYAEALDTLIRKNNEARQAEAKDQAEAVAEVAKLAASMRSEVNAVAAAANLTRGGRPFAEPTPLRGAIPSAAEVLR